MRRSRGFFLMAIVLVGGTLAASPTQAGERCHKINTRVEGTVNFATNTVEGRIIGGGILHGRAEGSFTFTSVDPQAGSATFVGRYLIRTKQGRL